MRHDFTGHFARLHQVSLGKLAARWMKRFQVGMGDVQTALFFELVEGLFLIQREESAAFDVGHHRRKQP